MTDWVRVGNLLIACWLGYHSSRLLPDQHAASAEFILTLIVALGIMTLLDRWIRHKQDDFRALLNRYGRAIEDRTRAELWSACHAGPFPIAVQGDAELSRRYVSACQVARELGDRVMEER